MRSKIVLLALFALFAILVGGIAFRQREPHTAPAAGATSAGASASASASASVGGDVRDSTPFLPGTGTRVIKLDRPLSAIGLGWDLITPGVVANEGLAPKDKGAFGKAGVKVRLAVADNPSAIEAALARGGSDEDGADIALLPLPTFVASYERLRALNLEMFYAVGWTRGREVLESTQLDSLTKIKPGSESKLHGAIGGNATFLGLFALQLSGVEPSEVTLVNDAEQADLIARSHSRASRTDGTPAKLLLTTGDAARLIPVVAVAQRGLVREQRPALVSWTRIWLQAIEEVDSDAASAARQVAKQPEAPEPVDLLARLGSLAPASLAANTELFRLSGRGAVSLDVLFFKAYELWRASRLLTTPPPVGAPVTAEVIAALALSEPGLVKPDPLPARRDEAKNQDEATVLLQHVVAGKHADENDLVQRVGYLAGVFPRSRLRLTVFGPVPVEVDGRRKLKAAKDVVAAVIERSTERYGLETERVSMGKVKRMPGHAACVEVLAVE